MAYKSKDIRKMYISQLRCLECNLIMPIPRKKARPREHGHIKTMYCARCQKITDFVENEDEYIPR